MLSTSLTACSAPPRTSPATTAASHAPRFQSAWKGTVRRVRMANAAQKRDVLNFEQGLEYTIALKYETGRQISNGRIMFTTVEGEVCFIDQDVADRIYDVKLRPQEPVKLVKQGRNGGLAVERVAGRQVSSAPTAPIATNEVEHQPQAHGNSLSGIMAASYISAIDALKIA